MARKLLKVCFIHPGGDDKAEAAPDHAADDLAARERPDNVRVIPITARPRMRAAVERMRLWENGKRLRVRFLDGDPAVQEKVANIAPEWQQYTNLQLDFVRDGTAEVRISFRDVGFSWSTVGTDSLTRGRTQASMNYGWLKPTTPVREYRRVVLHEFGHALGMIHEHQNPAAAGEIPWDKPKVYAYYARQDWTKDDVDENIFSVYATDATNFSAFDPTSIMEYPIPDELTIGSFSIGWNTELSELDKEFMRRQYPKGSPGTVELEVGAPPHEADLSVSAEVDTYAFDVPAAATHIMTTAGTTDVVLTLQGPNDAGALLAWDDDLGAGRNARIVRKLQPGKYWLGVRHKEQTGTGSYTIAVKRRRR
jgi:Bacterial pre-peptidase C-terminal domain/Astacin (Peptidase family M12A)